MNWTPAALTLLVIAAALPAGQPLRTVDAIDLSRYAGRWYEIARLPNRFQNKCAGDVIAHYALRSDSRIDVINQCRRSDGQIDQAKGIARRAAGAKSDAILQVRFAPAILSFLPGVWGDYWVIGLGPDYTWAVVGEPSRQYLWILARTPAMSDASFAQALEIAKGKGFDITRLVRTAHTRP
ncbi:MAG TPA: lipocalin family protein [Vicinamibacterales bacterium]|nr:lipocalin family protein [Vicinamibacterales bacterium]